MFCYATKSINLCGTLLLLQYGQGGTQLKQITYLLMISYLILGLVSCSNSDLPYLHLSHDSTETQEAFCYEDTEDRPINRFNIKYGYEGLLYENDYIYFRNGWANPFIFPENQTLWRYNIKTNNITSVCPDPVCKHNSVNCPLYAVSDIFYIHNNKVFANFKYIHVSDKNDSVNATDINAWAGFKMYDMENGKTLLRNEHSAGEYTQDSRILFTDNFCYYYDYMYNEELEDWVFAICRWDFQSNKIIILAGLDNKYDFDAPENLLTTFLFTIDDRIFFTDSNTLYSTDFNYQDRKDHIKGSFHNDVLTDGIYIYYGIPSSDGLQSIHRVDLDGNDYIDLGILVESGAWHITEKYIYYKKYDQIAIGKNRVSGYSGDEIILSNSEIWRCNHDGTQHEKIFKFDNELANCRFTNEVFVGNYIYGIYEQWTDANQDGIFEDEDYFRSDGFEDFKIMRIDITTGEIYIIDGI